MTDHTITIDPVGVQQASISGPVTGTLTLPCTFTVQAAPTTATPPLTYRWEATDQQPVTHTGTLEDAISYTWSTAGLKTVTVTASNAGGSATARQFINIGAGNVPPPVVNDGLIVYLPLVRR
jgi:PKD repeat protein